MGHHIRSWRPWVVSAAQPSCSAGPGGSFSRVVANLHANPSTLRVSAQQLLSSFETQMDFCILNKWPLFYMRVESTKQTLQRFLQSLELKKKKKNFSKHVNIYGSCLSRPDLQSAENVGLQVNVRLSGFCARGLKACRM